MLEFGDRRDFDDPRHQWRRLFSELLGTFFTVGHCPLSRGVKRQ